MLTFVLLIAVFRSRGNGGIHNLNVLGRGHRPWSLAVRSVLETLRALLILLIGEVAGANLFFRLYQSSGIDTEGQVISIVLAVFVAVFIMYRNVYRPAGWYPFTDERPLSLCWMAIWLGLSGVTLALPLFAGRILF
ncbi:hypothetical protein [Paenibacillus gansuensis]|uniref:Uncharacterized protein n=1 Tax=Paenibacillus gansuensis TaxID=306542 RepID=A0ABW5PHG0_9BACL